MIGPISLLPENVGAGAMKDDKEVKRTLGTPLIVPACPYGRKSGKTYALWTTPEVRRLLKARLIHPSSPESWCAQCKANPHLPHHRVRHEETACPRPGDTRKRIREEGQTPQGAANRLPARLAALVGQCLYDACEAKRATQAG